MTSKLARFAMVLALGCGGSSARTTTPSIATDKKVASGARPGSEVDTLWKAAPEGTVMGIVIAPGTTLKLYDMAEEFLRVVEARSVGAEMMAEARKEISELPFNVFDRQSFSSAGIDLSGGAAFFVDSEKSGTMILPVTNSEAFRKFTKATQKTIGETTIDVFDDDFYCMATDDAYLCMEDAEKLTAHTVTGRSHFAERVFRLPASYRGDAQLVMDMNAFEAMEDEPDEELHELFDELGLLAAVIQLERGSVTARAWMQAKPTGDLQAIVETGASVGGLSTGAGALRPSSFARMIVPLKLFLDEVPDQTLPGGASLRDDIFGKLTGEFVAYTPASATPWGRFAIGITEAQSFRALLNMGCALIPPMDFLEVTKGENRCDFVVDYDKVPGLDEAARSMFKGKLPVAVSVEEDQLALTIGREAPVVEGSSVSEMGKELLYKEWSYSLWTQNFSIIAGLDEPWSSVIKLQPQDMQEGMQYALWLLAHVSEFAGAVSVQADGLHILTHIGTYASDPDDAYKAFEAAITKNIEQGDSSAEFAEIRRKWPASQAAQQSAASGPFSEIFAKMIAKISVPAFVEYLERASASEAGNKAAK